MIIGLSGTVCLQIALLFFIQSASCSRKSTVDAGAGTGQTQKSSTPKEVVPMQTKGQWGGEGIAMDVSDDGATVEFDCAHGKITEKLAANSNGKFVAKGLFARESFGPTRQDDDLNGKPAIYSGTINDQTMTLTIKLDGSNETIGTYTLTKGKSGRIRKCA